MKLLLINPWVTDFAAFDLWMKPLGLLNVGAFMKKRGHTLRLVDCMDRFYENVPVDVSGNSRKYGTGKFHDEIIEKPACLENIPRYFKRYGMPLDQFKAHVLNGERPDAVLVTSIMTYWYQGVFEAISIIRELYPGVPVLLGGIYATLCESHARRFSGADEVITDSQPSRIIEAVEAAGGDAGEGEMTGDHVSDWPEPLWELYNNLPVAMVMTSRGCPMSCTVCASKRLFNGFERRDPVASARAIVALGNRGVKDCAFSDDALLMDAVSYAMPMFRELAKAGAPIRLHSPNGLHVREINPDTARLMKQAGMTTVRLSLETASDERAKDYSGKVNREEFRKAVAALFDAGYDSRSVGTYILVGLPGQTMDEVNDTIAFTIDCGIPVNPALFSPVPGTVEFARAVKAGMICEDDDPVMQNNTLRTIDFWEDGIEGYNNFRKMLSELNQGQSPNVV